MKISFLEAPEGLSHQGNEWVTLQQQVISQQPDLLITNEMPFGQWLAASNSFDATQASASITAHDEGLKALTKLNVPLILSSRPLLSKEKLVNEAFALVNGEYRIAHHKHYFPQESGFYETAWFRTEKTGFDILKTEQLNIGFLLCTELMFNEWARSYGRQGAHLIAVPRATGETVAHWKTAASMAAIVSGCYVVSSNRRGKYDDDLTFGGRGFAFAPDGSLIAETSAEQPVVSFDLDFNFIKTQQQQYPCYVREVPENLL